MPPTEETIPNDINFKIGDWTAGITPNTILAVGEWDNTSLYGRRANYPEDRRACIAILFGGDDYSKLEEVKQQVRDLCLARCKPQT